MKTLLGIVLIASTLFLSGCFDMPSVYPIYTGQTVVAEPRLVGAWQTKDGKDQIFIKETGDKSYRLTYLNDSGEALLWELRLIKLGETLIADLMGIKEDADIPAHHFLALSLDGPALKAWCLDSSSLREKAAREGLAYVRDKKDKVVLTARTESLAAFMVKNTAGEMKKDADLEFVALR